MLLIMSYELQGVEMVKGRYTFCPACAPPRVSTEYMGGLHI